MSAQVIDLTNRIEIEERSCKTVLLESVRVDLINQISRPLTAVFHFCFQKRAGSLFINNNFVHDLGVFRNITGFVPQVCFALERRKQLLGFSIGVLSVSFKRATTALSAQRRLKFVIIKFLGQFELLMQCLKLDLNRI